MPTNRKDYMREYMRRNKHKYVDTYKVKYECECGGVYRLVTRARHYKTYMHQNYLKTKQESNIAE
jgi:hypothetical protein